jgi:hypothetical protein
MAERRHGVSASIWPAKAFAATAAYDSAIAQWFAFADRGEMFPDTLPLTLNRGQELRYGENPHQQAALYVPAGPHGRGSLRPRRVQGKELSYNNYYDADAALESCAEFADTGPVCVIVKHANPAASRPPAPFSTPTAPPSPATRCRPSRHRRLEPASRRRRRRSERAIFTEVVIAPDGTRRRGRCSRARRTCACPHRRPSDPRRPACSSSRSRRLSLQSRDNGGLRRIELKVVTKRAPTSQELADCLFAWTGRQARQVQRHRLLPRDGATAGVGAEANEPPRIRPHRRLKARDAAEQAGLGGGAGRSASAVASTPSSPFADGLLAASRQVRPPVIQPGRLDPRRGGDRGGRRGGPRHGLHGMRHFRIRPKRGRRGSRGGRAEMSDPPSQALGGALRKQGNGEEPPPLGGGGSAPRGAVPEGGGSVGASPFFIRNSARSSWVKPFHQTTIPKVARIAGIPSASCTHSSDRGQCGEAIAHHDRRRGPPTREASASPAPARRAAGTEASP